MDYIEYKILSVLQKNARLTNLELAKQVGLSASPCLRRVKTLEDTGVISGYSAIINQNKVEILTKQPNLDLPKIILKLSESNIRIEDVQLPKASLEDVFIDLTGRKIND